MRKTNFDRIKNMDIEEMAEFISSIDIDECSGVTYIEDEQALDGVEDIKKWLEEEIEEGD